MNLDEYARLLAESGPKKMRALSMLLSRDDESRFETAVLMHEAVWIDERAFKLLSHPGPETVLGYWVERVVCLLEGLDPARGLGEWVYLDAAAQYVPSETRDAMLGRVGPLLESAERKFGTMLNRTPLLKGLWTPSVLDPKERAKAERALEAVLKVYPGIATFWSDLSSLYQHRNDSKRAWDALKRASRLEPENHIYGHTTYWLAPQVLPLEELTRYYDDADTLGLEARFLLALGTIEAIARGRVLPRGVERAERLLSVDVPDEALLHVPADYLRTAYKGAKIMLESARTGLPPTEQALRDANLDNVISIAARTKRSATQVLAEQTINWMSKMAA